MSTSKKQVKSILSIGSSLGATHSDLVKATTSDQELQIKMVVILYFSPVCLISQKGLHYILILKPAQPLLETET